MEEEVSVSPVSVSSRSSPTSLAILGAVSPNSSTRRSVQLDLDDIMLPSMQLVQVDASEDVWGELERLLYNNETTTPSSPVKCSAHPESGHIPVLRTVSAASSDNNAVGHRRQASVGDWNVASMSSVLELTSLKSNSGHREFLLLPHQESAKAPQDAQNGTSSKVGGKRRGFIIMDLDPSPTKVVPFQQLMADASCSIAEAPSLTTIQAGEAFSVTCTHKGNTLGEDNSIAQAATNGSALVTASASGVCGVDLVCVCVCVCARARECANY
jgi:hypothetical protein